MSFSILPSVGAWRVCRHRLNPHRLKSTAIIGSLMAISFTHPVQAIPITQIEGVVVTASRQPVSAHSSGAFTTILTTEQLERFHTVADALRHVPGVNVAQNGGYGQPASVFIRGTESSHVLVLIDGVKANDPSNTTNFYDFAHLTTQDIARIEILRGPQSSLYGSEAIGGVIHIITKGYEGGKRMHEAYVEGGSFGTIAGGARTSGKEGPLKYNVQVSRLRQQGFSSFNEQRGGAEDDGYRNTTISARTVLDAGDEGNISTSLRYVTAKAEYDNFGSDAANLAKTRQLALRSGWNAMLIDGFWEQDLSVSYYDTSRDDASAFGSSVFNGQRVGVHWLHHLHLNSTDKLTIGAETMDEQFDSSFNSEENVRSSGLFANYHAKLAPGLYTDIGARHERHDEFGSETTYRGSVAYILAATDTRLQANVGTGFKAPSLFQLYSSFGDPNLQPETSRSVDIGLTQPLWNRRAELQVAAYYNDIDDLIDFDTSLFRYSNVREARTQGMEIGLRVNPFEPVEIAANYTFTDAEDKATNLALLRRARHTASLSASYFWDQLAEVRATVRYVGSRPDNDLSFNRTRIDSFTVLDLYGSYRLNETIELYARGDNLLDKQYEEVFSYGTAGRSGYVGVRGAF